MRKILITAKNVSHTFTGVDGLPLAALHDVTLELESGTFTCLIGPSGCGKSTLLRILAGLIQPQRGSVYLSGQILTKPQRRISMVFQDDNLMPWRTVAQNIALPLELAGVSTDIRREQVAYWLDITDLQGFANRYPAELSGGMAQRVAIARGLITEPDLLLLDEPFGALDALTRETMWQELLLMWQRTQATVLMVTHSIREAILLADHVLVMSARPGSIVQEELVNFGRPRSLDLLSESSFVTMEAHIREAIR